jgi:hypothetical protein
MNEKHDYPESHAPTEPGWYEVFKDGIKVDMMWIPDQGGYVARYFGNQFCMEKRPEFDLLSHTFRKIDTLLI